MKNLIIILFLTLGTTRFIRYILFRKLKKTEPNNNDCFLGLDFILFLKKQNYSEKNQSLVRKMNMLSVLELIIFLTTFLIITYDSIEIG